mgnify:CR=1 FL=1
MKRRLSSVLIVGVVLILIILTGCPQQTASLTLIFDDTQGTITCTPSKNVYEFGEQVALQATAETGFHFDHWASGATGSENPLEVILDGNTEVTAVFEPNMYTITISDPTNGQIQIDGIDASGTLSIAYGTEISLHAVGDTGYSLSSWTDDISGSENPKVVTVTEDMSIGATFSNLIYQLTVLAPTNGAIKEGDQLLTAGTHDYPYGTSLTLTPVPDEGYDFSRWTGSSNMTTTPYTFTITEDSSIGAIFTPETYTITVNTATHGEILKDGSIFTSGSFEPGTNITLTAVPDEGYTLDSWGCPYGNYSTEPEIEVTIDKDIPFSPVFREYDHLIWKHTYADFYDVYSAPSIDPENNIFSIISYYQNNNPISSLLFFTLYNRNIDFNYLGASLDVARHIPPMVTPEYSYTDKHAIITIDDDTHMGSYELTNNSSVISGYSYEVSPGGISGLDVLSSLSYTEDTSTATVGDGDIYFRAQNGTLYAIENHVPRQWNAEKVSVVTWTNDSFGTAEGSDISISEDGLTLYFTVENTLYAVNTSDGTRKWVYSYTATSNTDLSTVEPVIDSNGNIYVSTEDHRLLKIDESGNYVSTGPTTADWSTSGYGYSGGNDGFDISIDEKSVPVIDGNGILYLPGSGKIRAIDSSDCDVQWNTSLESSNAYMLLGSDNRLYATSGSKLYALDRDTGSIEWSYDLDDVADSSSITLLPPVITSDGILVVIKHYTYSHNSQGATTTAVFAFETESLSGIDSNAPWPMYRGNGQRTGERQ